MENAKGISSDHRFEFSVKKLHTWWWNNYVYATESGPVNCIITEVMCDNTTLIPACGVLGLKENSKKWIKTYKITPLVSSQ